MLLQLPQECGCCAPPVDVAPHCTSSPPVASRHHGGEAVECGRVKGSRSRVRPLFHLLMIKIGKRREKQSYGLSWSHRFYLQRRVPCAVCWITQSINANHTSDDRFMNHRLFCFSLRFFIFDFLTIPRCIDRFCFRFVHVSRLPCDQSEGSVEPQPRGSVSTADSSRSSRARGAPPPPGLVRTLTPRCSALFQATLLDSAPETPRADSGQDEAFSQVKRLHFDKSCRCVGVIRIAFFFLYISICDGIQGAHLVRGLDLVSCLQQILAGLYSQRCY